LNVQLHSCSLILALIMHTEDVNITLGQCGAATGVSWVSPDTPKIQVGGVRHPRRS